MPLYNYKCNTCYRVYELLMPGRADIIACPLCDDEAPWYARGTFRPGIAIRQPVSTKDGLEEVRREVDQWSPWLKTDEAKEILRQSGNKEANMNLGDFIYRVEIDHEAGVAHARVEVDTISAVYTDSIVVGDVSAGHPGRRVFSHAHTTPEAALGAYRAAAMENIRERMRSVDRETAIIDRELAALKSIDALIEGTTAIVSLKES